MRSFAVGSGHFEGGRSGVQAGKLGNGWVVGGYVFIGGRVSNEANHSTQMPARLKVSRV